MRGACPPFADVLPSWVYCVRAASCGSCSCLCVCACPMLRVAHHVSCDTSRMQGQIHKPHNYWRPRGESGAHPTSACCNIRQNVRRTSGEPRTMQETSARSTTTTTLPPPPPPPARRIGVLHWRVALNFAMSVAKHKAGIKQGSGTKEDVSRQRANMICRYGHLSYVCVCIYRYTEREGDRERTIVREVRSIVLFRRSGSIAFSTRAQHTARQQ